MEDTSQEVFGKRGQNFFELFYRHLSRMAGTGTLPSLPLALHGRLRQKLLVFGALQVVPVVERPLFFPQTSVNSRAISA